MSDNKKFYYLKLKENFFNKDEIKLLEQKENGYIYSNLYLKLCLMSLKGEGKLLFRNEIPFDEEMISAITGVPLDNVRVGIAMLQQLGLIKKINSGEMYMTDIQDMIGHSSSESERKKLYREKIKNLQIETISGQIGTMSQNVPKIVHQSKSKSKRLETDIPNNSRQMIISLFYNDYNALYNNKLVLNNIELGCIKNLLKFPYQEIEQKFIRLKNKCKEKPEYYTLLPSVLLKHWNKLVDNKTPNGNTDMNEINNLLKGAM